jgi:acyl-CoA reductase-like NAD-dependent aldehyde dehydrogenase
MALPLRDVPPPRGKLESINPATGEPLGDVPAASPDEARAAVARARAAQKKWGALPAAERASYLRALCDQVIERAADIARTDHIETGKVLAEAGGMIVPVADLCRHYAKLCVELEPGRAAGVGPLLGKKAHTYYRPLGVAAVISPWNYPFYLAMLHIVPALAAGNAVVHKPSEHTPRVGLLIGEMARAAGFPEGVLEIVVGDGSIGAAIIDAHVDIVSFTGAPPTGKKILAAAAQHLTPVVMELGGKDAAIVCDDADLERAANGVTWGAFINAGQTCIAFKRAIVADRIYDRFVEMLAERARALATSPDLGAITMARELGRLERHVASAKRAGARVVAGGGRIDRPGTYFAPTVIADCTPDMDAVREETFGPLLTVLRARDDADAVRMANDSEFGLGGSVWTRDEARAQAIVAQLHTGSCCINDGLVQAANPRLPFGGVKGSGYGRAAGELGYLTYCNVQSVMTAVLQPQRDPTWFPYTETTDKLVRKISGLYHGSWSEKLRRLFQ